MRQKFYLSLLFLLLTAPLFSQTVWFTSCNEPTAVMLTWNNSANEYRGSGTQGNYELYNTAGWKLALPNGNLQFYSTNWNTLPPSSSSSNANGWLQSGPCAQSTFALYAAADVTTYAASNISFTTATLNGNVSFDGNGPVTEKGIVYSTSSNPTVADMKLTSGAGIGTIAAGAIGLAQGTTYYVRAYATNSTGTVYGNQTSFTTLSPLSVSSIIRASSAFTNASSVSYAVSFSSNATGVTANAFSLTTTGGVSGASITSVSGSGNVYMVTLNTGTGDGTIRLDVSGTGMTIAPSNVPYTTGQVYSIDKTAPNSTIDSKPAALSNLTTATFAFSADESPATFEASLDGAAYATVTSPKSYTGLSSATHTFSVRSIDALGNVETTPATYTWEVDAIAPPAPVVTTVPDGATVTTYRPSYSGTAEKNATVQIFVDGISSGTTIASSTGVWGYTQPTILANGTHTVMANATDAANNTSTNSNINTFTVSVLTINETSVPAATVGVSYSKTVTAAYGTAPYNFAITSGSLPAGLNLASNGTISGTPTAGGSFSFRVTVTDGGSNTANQLFSMTVNDATLVMSPTSLPNGDQNVPYTATTFSTTGGTAPYLYIPSGLPTGLTMSNAGVISGTPTQSGSFSIMMYVQDASTGTGPYSTIKNYSLVINSLPVITFNGLSNKTYGDADFTLTATSSNTGMPVTYTSSDATVASISGNQVHILKAGSVTITASQAGDANHGAPVDKQQTLTIDKKAITVTATAASKVYGATDPTLSFTYVPALVGTDVFTGNVARQPGSNVNNYNITQGTLTLSDNYSITFVPANFEITPAPLKITADDQTKVYGTDNPTLTASYTGLTNGDNETNFATAPLIGVTAGRASAVGYYPITASNASNPNYTITYVAGNLHITPATITVTADDKTKVYGANVPALTASYSGWVNTDNESNIATAPTLSTGATSASPVGSYTITASGANIPNYDIVYAPGNLSVTAAALTITADDKTKVYGAGLPTLSATITGFVNNENSSILMSQPNVTTTATAASPVGNYSITAYGAAASNYTISYVAGNLSVTPASLLVTADDQTKVYGDDLPTLTASYSGWVNNDGVANLTTAPTIVTTATKSSAVGNYPITASGAVDANYTITYAAGNLSVTKATLTITADDKTKIYGENNPTLTVSYSGFVNNDDATKLTTAASINTSATAASNVGDYTIIASGAANANYDINYVNGKLSVTPAALTITAEDKTKDYGAALPTFTVTYSGWVNNDGVASLTTAPAITTTATAASDVGNYPITASGAVNANYNISYVAGNLAVNAVPLAIKAEDKTKVYGDADPSLTYLATGWVNGDGNSVITGAMLRVTGENVGNYAINQNTLSAGNNYIITYTAGKLVITPATLTITADAQTKVYGTADPALTFVPTGWKNGDGTSVITGGLSRVAGENVGNYAIQQGSLAAGNNYTISYVGNQFTITKAPQVITWIQDLTIGCTADITPVQLNATANSGLTVSYTIANTGVATVGGNTLTPVQPGTTVVTASQPGDDNHFPAPSVTNNLNYRSASAVRQHWSDVLMFDNSSNNFAKWDWYKNNTLVANQTSAYYSESAALSGTYYVIATDKNGVAVQSCPLTLNGSATVTAGIKVYPNPATAGSNITVTCNYTDAALQGAKMAIVDMSGKIVQEITSAKATQTLTAPSARGMYYITLLLKNGAKASVNLLVK